MGFVLGSGRLHRGLLFHKDASSDGTGLGTIDGVESPFFRVLFRSLQFKSSAMSTAFPSPLMGVNTPGGGVVPQLLQP